MESSEMFKLLLEKDKKSDKTLIETLFEERRFFHIEKTGKNKSHSKYLLSGSGIQWNENPGFSYSYDLRLSGDNSKLKEILEDIDDDTLNAIKLIIKDDKVDLDKENLVKRLITQDNRKDPDIGPGFLYEHEILKHKEHTKKIKEKEKNSPGVDEIYDAFIKYKDKVKDGTKRTGVKGRTLRMDNVGEIYLNMETGHMLNVYGYYSNKDGQAEVIKVEGEGPVYEIDGKTLYKVPDYQILSSRRQDLDYALKDLSRQNAIELGPNKIKGVLDEWASVKNKK